MKQFDIWTDGSCYHKDRIGGCGWVYVFGDVVIPNWAGPFYDTTVNQMELMGVIRALEGVTEPSLINIYTDSQYVERTFNEERWRRWSWSPDAVNPVKNRDLWMRLFVRYNQLDGSRLIKFHHVRGHTGLEYNELADKMAGKGRKHRFDL